MIKVILSKTSLLLCFLLLIPVLIFSQDNKDKAKITQNNAPSNGGFERTIRKGNEGSGWSWGTMGHGSFDQTIELFKTDEFFKPDKDVLVYKQGQFRYRVFTHGEINYIEVSYGFGNYTYVTKP